MVHKLQNLCAEISFAASHLYHIDQKRGEAREVNLCEEGEGEGEGEIS